MDDIVYTLSRATELDQRTSALGALTTLLDHQPIVSRPHPSRHVLPSRKLTLPSRSYADICAPV